MKSEGVAVLSSGGGDMENGGSRCHGGIETASL